MKPSSLVPLGCLLLLVAPLRAADTEEEKIIAEVKKCGGRVGREDAAPGKPVVRVDLSQSIVTNDVVARLKGLKQLRSLNLSATQITDQALEHLKEMESLRTLDLNATGVTNKGLAHLKGLRHLETLELGDCVNVTNDGLTSIGAMTGLKSLFLSGTGVNDEGLPRLKGLTRLQTLHFFDTDVTDDGIRELRKALPKVKISK